MRKHSRSAELNGCKLSRKDLEDLVALITSDAGSNAYTKFESKLGISQIESKSLDEFLSEVSDIEVLRYLRIYVSRLGKNDYTSLYVRAGTVDVTVTGEDETWVRGRLETIVSRLKRTRSRYTAPPKLLAAIGVPCMLVGEVLTLATKGTLRALGDTLVLVGFLTSLIYMAQWSARRSEVRIAADREGFWNFDRVMQFSILAGTIVIAVFTILLWNLTP